MLSTFAAVSPYLKFRRNVIEIDNVAYRMHYKWTFAILLVSTLLVCARQFIGSHIDCITEGAIPAKVINTFCFFTSTYTIVNHLNGSSLDAGEIPHPGVGPDIYGRGSEKRHAYYQWVPFVLFAQAILFCAPHLLWKKLEGGNLMGFCRGLKMTQISRYMEKEEKIATYGRSFPSKTTRDESAYRIKEAFINRLRVNEYWGTYLILTEALNVVNVIIQIYAVNRFLAGQFLDLGFRVMHESWGSIDILDIVFPKVTKCTFRKFGPSGTIQVHDSLCIMALNVINEKIYTFLWFWFWALLAISILTIVWRMFTMCLHRFGPSAYDANTFSYASARRLDRRDVEIVSQNCSYSNWLFLYYLASNLDGDIFQQVLRQLAEEFVRHAPEDDENAANHMSEQDEGNGSGVGRTKHRPIDTVDSGQLLVEKKKLG